MPRRPRIWPAIVIAIAVSGGRVMAEDTPRPFLVAAYLPDWRVERFDLSALDGPITDLIYFSIEPKPTGELDLRRANPKALARVREARTKRGQRLLVAVGGWGRSSGFGRMATNPEARARFVKELAAFCREHHLDGADFDWEHPSNKAEEEGYAALVADTKRAFAPNHLLVSLTVADWQNLPAEAFQTADRVQVMSYDHRGRHSTPEQARADIETLVRKGVPKPHLVLGLPFYGRSIQPPRREMSYDQIVRRHKPDANSDEADGVYFNGPRTIEAKTREALDLGLGGVMIWEISQDAPGEPSLLRAIGRVAPRPAATKEPR